MGKSFSGCEIIEIAIQIEKNGIDFYNGLIEMSKHDKAKEVFKYLAQQEEEHIRIFKGIFDPKCSYEPQGAYPDEYFAYMNALASGYIFTKENKGKEIASGVKNDKEAIDLGIKFEKESILFYEGMRKWKREKI